MPYDSQASPNLAYACPKTTNSSAALTAWLIAA